MSLVAYGTSSDDDDEEEEDTNAPSAPAPAALRPASAQPQQKPPSRPASLVSYNDHDDHDDDDEGSAATDKANSGHTAPAPAPAAPVAVKTSRVTFAPSPSSSMGVVRRAPSAAPATTATGSGLRNVTTMQDLSSESYAPSAADGGQSEPPGTTLSSREIMLTVLPAIDAVELPPETTKFFTEDELKQIPLYAKKASNKSVMEYLQGLKSFRNPKIYEKLIELYELDEFGSNYPQTSSKKGVKRVPDGTHYEELAELQKKRTEQRERERLTRPRTEISFVSSSSSSTSSVTNASTPPPAVAPPPSVPSAAPAPSVTAEAAIAAARAVAERALAAQRAQRASEDAKSNKRQRI